MQISNFNLNTTSMVTFTNEKEKQQFITEATAAKRDFIKEINKLPWNNKFRTSAETLIIMYDQMADIIQRMKDES